MFGEGSIFHNILIDWGEVIFAFCFSKGAARNALLTPPGRQKGGFYISHKEVCLCVGGATSIKIVP
jgi:hypothetical protein